MSIFYVLRYAMKYVLWILFSFIALFSVSFAQEYILFYGNGCPHCAAVQDYIKTNKLSKTFAIDQKEVFYNTTNRAEFNSYLAKHNLTYDKIGVPFLIITSGTDCNYINGDTNIIDYFSGQLAKVKAAACKDTTQTGTMKWLSGNYLSNDLSRKSRLKFFGIMLPAALSDSINPCAFAVMLLLLTTILTKHRSRRKTLRAWVLFALAIFLTYLFMGIGLFSALANANNTFVIKLCVWILGLVVWLANLKDFFRYGKWFVMEVPFSWRPAMMGLIERVSSPAWAFVVGVFVSLFLLPCSSGPYFTILWYLSSQSSTLTHRGYIYLIFYNLMFVLPMLTVAFLVAFGVQSVDRIAEIKHKNTKLIHLIVGLLMLGLGAYVLLTL